MASAYETPQPPGFTFDQPDAVFVSQLNGRLGINMFTDPEDTDQRIRVNCRPVMVNDPIDNDNDYD